MLNGIILVRTDLRNADLDRAHPGDTNLSVTDLSGANFSEADLPVLSSMLLCRLAPSSAVRS